jgi:hypothetical protein
MPPLGDYSLYIAPEAARATANKTMMKTYTYFTGRFEGHGNAPVCYCTHCPMEEVHNFTRSHWAPPSGKNLLQSKQLDMAMPCFCDFFHGQLVEKEHQKMSRPHLTIGV